MTTARNVLCSNVEIIGEISFGSDLIVDGKIDGKVISKGNLTIGENATIKGDIEAGSAIVFGRVDGNLRTTDSCILKPECVVEGDISARALTMEEGASFSGRSSIGAKAGS